METGVRIRDVTPAAAPGGEEDALCAGLRRAFAAEPDVRVLAGLGLPVGADVERLGTVVVHRGGLAVLRSVGRDGLACLGEADHDPVHAEPCRHVIAVRRQAEALRAHVAMHAAELLRRRLLPRVFAAALPVAGLVVPARPACPSSGEVCRTLVLTPHGAEGRVRDLMTQPPQRDRLGRRAVLTPGEIAAVAEHLMRVHVRPVTRRPVAELAVAAFVTA